MTAGARWACALAVALGCARGQADPSGGSAQAIADDLPAWCATKGRFATVDGAAAIDAPTFRAVAPATAGDAAELEFTYRGPTAKVVALASGQRRRQLGLKLRAEDGCNLVYVMWRLEPTRALVVSVKRNPGQHDHRGCGAGGYTDVATVPAPALAAGDHRVLAAAIVDDTLAVAIDGVELWRGALPAAARDLRGPAGVRSDNVAWTARLRGPVTAGAAARCRVADGD